MRIYSLYYMYTFLLNAVQHPSLVHYHHMRHDCNITKLNIRSLKIFRLEYSLYFCQLSEHNKFHCYWKPLERNQNCAKKRSDSVQRNLQTTEHCKNSLKVCFTYIDVYIRTFFQEAQIFQMLKNVETISKSRIF